MSSRETLFLSPEKFIISMYAVSGYLRRYMFSPTVVDPKQTENSQ